MYTCAVQVGRVVHVHANPLKRGNVPGHKMRAGRNERERREKRGTSGEGVNMSWSQSVATASALKATEVGRGPVSLDRT
eukprot:6949594-Pyramimonas_sp.AAC.1